MQDDTPVGDWYDFTIIYTSSFQNFADLGSERFFFFEMFTAIMETRLLSTWLRMEIITHSGPVTLLVGRDGGERDRPSKVPLRYRSTRCFSWLPSIPVYICGTEWAKSKTQASCRPLQWLNTRMIEDYKSHVSTGSRYPPNINILKPTQQGLYIRHTGDQNRWYKADAGDNREPTPAKYSWFMLCGISLLTLPSAVSFPCSGNWIASIYRNAYYYEC